MFFNSLPLGMIWGLLWSFLEGRRFSEILGSTITLSIVFASGLMKTIGSIVLNHGFSEFWMPCVVGALFFPLIVLTSYILELLPNPSAEDIRIRTKRVPMSGADRIRFLLTFWPGLLASTICYMLLTVFRNFREDFSIEIAGALGVSGSAIFAESEIIVSVVLLIPICLLNLVKENINSMIGCHLIVVTGWMISGGAAILYQKGWIGGMALIVFSGIGLHTGYIPLSSVFFDRMIATYKYPATSGFLMYVSDSLGQLLTFPMFLFKNFAAPDLSWGNFFLMSTMFVSCAGTLLILLSLIYFVWKYYHFVGTAASQ
jgi:hypothetical protein